MSEQLNKKLEPVVGELNPEQLSMYSKLLTDANNRPIAYNDGYNLQEKEIKVLYGIGLLSLSHNGRSPTYSLTVAGNELARKIILEELKIKTKKSK
jgi:hypothetical protein